MSKQENGQLAEKIALIFEKLRIGKAADKTIRFVGNRRNLGFDIQSTNSEEDKTPRFIEVKSLTDSGHIFVTERERINLKALGKNAWLYVVDTKVSKVIRLIQDPIANLDLPGCALTYKIKV